MILFEVFVESTHGVNVLLPDGKQDLDIATLAHRCSKRGGKLARFIEACFLCTSAERSIQGPKAGEDLSVRSLADADLFTVIEGEPEWIAKSSKRPLGGIGLGTFERKLVSLPRGRGLAFACP